MPIVHLEHISKNFGGVRSLIDVSLEFSAGEAVALAGENGSGKSTLIKILSGAHQPSAGRIYIDGTRQTRFRPIDAVRAGIQVIYQDFSLFPNLSVAENIVFSRTLNAGERIVRRARSRQVAALALEQLQVTIDLDALVESLPVASKQLVAIARALVDRARLIVMDEPTTALTQTEVTSLLAIIQRLKAAGVCVVFVSHKLQEVFSVCNRVVVLRNGEQVAQGPIGQFDALSLTRHMTGRELPESVFAGQAADGAEVLRVDGLTRAGRFTDVSLRVREGEIVGIAGLLGSGRTELVRSLFGLDPANAGAIRIGRQLVAIPSPQAAIAHGIAYVPEDRLTEGLFFGQTVQANVEAGLFGEFTRALGWLDKRSLAVSVRGWLRSLSVKGQSYQPIGALSGGNQQRVVLARWLAQRPKLLLLNGPTVGVDVGSKADIHTIIKDHTRSGMGTLMVSDDLSELVACCNRVLVMRDGRVVREFAGAALSEAALAGAITV